jgi:hypothetical protein
MKNANCTKESVLNALNWKIRPTEVINENFPNSNAWIFELSKNGIMGNSQKFEFFTGKGRKERPKIEDLLECLALDTSLADCSFNDFCDDCGYSNDSINAFNTYQKIAENTKRILSLMSRQELELFQEC